MQITLCEDTYVLIRPEILCTELGEVDIKGFGIKQLYNLESELRPDADIQQLNAVPKKTPGTFVPGIFN